MRLMQWLSVVLIGVGLAIGTTAPTLAQVPKSGEATLRLVWRIDWSALVIGEGEVIAGGPVWGSLTNESGAPFFNGAQMYCQMLEHLTDPEAGTYASRHLSCKFTDGEGDMVLVNWNCATETYDDVCTGDIVRGTGKFQGITGTWGFKGWPGSGMSIRYASPPTFEIGEVQRFEGEGMNVNPVKWTIR